MRILIVEDDPKMAMVLRDALEKRSHRIVLAPSGSEGLDIALHHQFEAIILDAMLPGMDGYAVARSLRQSKISTPILMLTARDATSDVVRGLDSGVDDYLTKPFAFEELFARLRALSRRTATAAVLSYRLSDLELDPATHAATRSGSSFIGRSEQRAVRINERPRQGAFTVGAAGEGIEHRQRPLRRKPEDRAIARGAAAAGGSKQISGTIKDHAARRFGPVRAIRLCTERIQHRLFSGGGYAKHRAARMRAAAGRRPIDIARAVQCERSLGYGSVRAIGGAAERVENLPAGRPHAPGGKNHGQR